MRKTYSKPQIMFEAFTLNTSIAAGCSLINTLPNVERECGFEVATDRFGNDIVFNTAIQDVTGCNVGAEGPYNDLCYDNPRSEYIIFQS